MKTCAACGRPLASHGGKAAIQSSEMGRKAAAAPCCEPQAKPTPDSSKSARTRASGIKRLVSKRRGTRRQFRKQRIRARRRKKLGHFFPARITLRPRHPVEQTASEAPRPRRRALPPFRTRRRRIKSARVG